MWLWALKGSTRDFSYELWAFYFLLNWKENDADGIKLRSGMRVTCLVFDFKMLITLDSDEAMGVTLGRIAFLWSLIKSPLCLLVF